MPKTRHLWLQYVLVAEGIKSKVTSFHALMPKCSGVKPNHIDEIVLVSLQFCFLQNHKTFLVKMTFVVPVYACGKKNSLMTAVFMPKCQILKLRPYEFLVEHDSFKSVPRIKIGDTITVH